MPETNIPKNNPEEKTAKIIPFSPTSGIDAGNTGKGDDDALIKKIAASTGDDIGRILYDSKGNAISFLPPIEDIKQVSERTQNIAKDLQKLIGPGYSIKTLKRASYDKIFIDANSVKPLSSKDDKQIEIIMASDGKINITITPYNADHYYNKLGFDAGDLGKVASVVHNFSNNIEKLITIDGMEKRVKHTRESHYNMSDEDIAAYRGRKK